MYTYYIVRLYFDNDAWGFVSKDSKGKFSLTSDIKEALLFDKEEKAMEYYYDNFNDKTRLVGKSIMQKTSDGAKVTNSIIVTVTSKQPMN